VTGLLTNTPNTWQRAKKNRYGAKLFIVMTRKVRPIAALKSLLQYVFNGVPGDGVIACKQDFLRDSSGGYQFCQPGRLMVLLL